MRRLVGLASILLLFATALAGQVRETVNVNYVEVPVTVLDRNGDPVRGLTKERFEIYDQGKLRPISSFDTIDFASPQSMKAASPLNPALRRNFLLLFDLTFSSPVGRAKAQEAARNFIARGMKRYDLAAVATVDVDRGFRLLTAFTSDRNLLNAAVGNPVLFRSSDPLQIAGQITVDPTMAQTPQQEANRTDKDINLEDVASDIVREETRMNERFYRSRIDREVRLLEGIARTVRMLPGRKQVVFFSEGFDPRLIEGRDAQAMGEAMQDMDQIENGETWKVDSDLRYGNTGSLKLVDELAAACRASDVVLDAVDIQGVRVNNSIENGATINSNAGLFLLAGATGGEVFRNSNDLTSDLEHMLRAQEVVYVLGFQPPVTSPGKFHELRVRVRDVPGARVSARSGYYEHGSENPLERTLTAAQIILNDIPQDEIGVAALAVPFPTAGKSQVPVILEIDGADLIAAAKTSIINVELYLYAFDDEGLVRDRIFQVIGLDLPKVAAKLKENGIKYYGTLSLPAGKYTIRTLVHVRETDRKGYARTDISVPGTNDVAVLPPFFVEDPGKWLMVKGSSHDATNSGYPFQINGNPFIPSAAVHLHAGQPREFAVFVYNVGKDELSWQTSVRDGDGSSHEVAAKVVQESSADDVTKLMFQYAPEAADGDAARFDVTIHKKGSTDERQVSVPLTLLRSKGEIR